MSNTLLLIRARLSSPPPRHSFVLASTQDLHEKINQLANRVRDLEDALRASHTLHSVEPHPLLSEDLLRIKAPIQRENLINTGATNGNSDEQGADVVDSFGSLSISEGGRTNYFGQATSSWVSRLRDEYLDAVLIIASYSQYYLTVRGNHTRALICTLTLPTQNEDNQDDLRDHRPSQLAKLLSPEVLSLSGLFPIAPSLPLTVDAQTMKIERLRSLFWYLPGVDEASELRRIYFQNAAWMYVSHAETVVRLMTENDPGTIRSRWRSSTKVPSTSSTIQARHQIWTIRFWRISSLSYT